MRFKWGLNDTFRNYTGKKRRKVSSLTRYAFPECNNVVDYLSGNKYRYETWKRLQGRKFNLVFSDAHHRPESIMSELDMFERLDLLDSAEFAILWDDLGGQMSEAFLSIADRLKARYKLHNGCAGIVRVRGSYCNEAGPHKVGYVFKLDNFRPNLRPAAP